MLINFFFTLRAAKLPVSVKEYLMLLEALQVYRATFRPSATLAQPYAMVGINAVVADSDAEAAFRQAIGLDPRLDRAWYGLALVLVRQQRHDEAVQALRRNTELQPMSPYGWYQLARVHVDRQEPDKARRIITRLKSFEPGVAAQLERETGLTG